MIQYQPIDSRLFRAILGPMASDAQSAAMTTLERPDSRVSNPHARWLALARRVWYGTAAIALALVVASVPTYFLTLGSLTDAERELGKSFAPLTLFSPSPTFEFWTDVAITLTSLGASFLSLGLAALIFRRRSNDWTGLLASFTLLLYGVVLTGPLEFLLGYIANATMIALIAEAYLWFPFVILFYIFPDGKFVPPITRWLALIVIPLGVGLAVLTPQLYQGVDDFKLTAFAVVYTLFSLTGPAAQVYRYVRVANASQRQQIKWVVIGFTVFIASATIVPSILLYAARQLPDGTAPDFGVMVVIFFGRMAWWLGLFALPLSITVAILRYRLWDIDVILNRALVYGSLTLMIVGLYVFIVGYLSNLFHIPGHLHQAADLIVSLIAAGIVAVLFQPLRDRLQRRVNRLMYGERDDPYAVLSHLSQRLEVALAPDAVLPTIVETIAQTLRLPCVGIALKEAETGQFKFVAVYPTTRDHVESSVVPPSETTNISNTELGRVSLTPRAEPLQNTAREERQAAAGQVEPLTYQGEVIGQLIFAPRAPGEAFTPAEKHLLANIAQQAAVAVHAVRLTADLRRSREQLVLAREEERRRLRRDLHDGLGPTLAALALTASTVRDLISTDPAAATALTNELQTEIRGTVAEIRRLVYALRPPSLDELGLVAAIRESASQSSGHLRAAGSQNGLRVTVEAPDDLPPLPAAVEVAAYRIAQEALTNVVRHAHARNCAICISLDESGLSAVVMEICDDGVGLPAERHAGVGLRSMRERAEELGGTCVIENLSGAGTRVYARLPIRKE